MRWSVSVIFLCLVACESNTPPAARGAGGEGGPPVLSYPVGGAEAGQSTPGGDPSLAGVEGGSGAYIPTVFEVCGNGLDDEQNGLADDGCPCTLGDTQPCYLGDPRVAGVGACGWGEQRCVEVELRGNIEERPYQWSACEGYVEPSPERCDGADRDCDGLVEERCDSCEEGATRPCSGDCSGAEERCEGGVWTGCPPAPSLETLPARALHSPWEMNDGEGLISYNECTDRHGAVESYSYAMIPPEGDAGWRAAPDQDIIGYSEPSTLCGMVECRCGADFTYFRTFVDIEAGASLGTFTIEMSGMDDGVRCTIFNSSHPDGVTVEGAYVFLGGSATANLAPYVVAGERNTILLTHVDDCCSESNLNRASIVIDGQTVTRCGN